MTIKKTSKPDAQCGSVAKFGHFYYLVEPGVFMFLTEKSVASLPVPKQIEVRESIKILGGKEVKLGS